MTIKERFHQFLSPSASTELLSPSASSSSSNWYMRRPSFSSRSSRKSSYEITNTDTGKKDTTENDYHIVLIDIKETVEKRKIECTKKLMDEPGLRYCAISYRWGEVPEQVAVTPDYVAHVTSFALADLELLCGQLLVSADEHVDYVWVDAVSIDQRNDQARKTAIRQMNNIYHHATMILAVPDLHLSYLKLNPVNKYILTQIRKHTPNIYRHVTGACQITTQPNPSQQHYTHEFPHIATMITPSTSHSTTSSPISPETPFTPFTPLTPATPAEQEHEQDQQQQQQPLPCECYRQTKGIGKSCIKAIAFLQYLVEDWSNRVWVISEYHIGRTKNMKIWFLSFDIQWYYTTRPSFVPLFDCIYRNHFRHRPFLDMMLNSRAAKNEDRFYAVLPLSVKYKDCIETQDTVSQWQITDMTSVCMRLYTFVGIREKVAMLYNCSKGRMLILPSFASCYTHGNGNNDTLTKILDLQRDRLLVQNIVLMTPSEHRHESATHHLLHRHDSPFQPHLERAYLKLRAKCHRILSTANKDTKNFWQQHANICQQLEWSSGKKSAGHHQHRHSQNERYHLDQVFIPFIESGIRTPFGIHLVGDRTCNRWILHQLTIINVNVPAIEWRLVEEVEEFNIY